MLRLWDRVSELWNSVVSGDDPSASNIKMMLIAAAFLMVTIVLILLQPGMQVADDRDLAIVDPMPAQTPPTEPETQVTRADASLLGLETPQVSVAVSRQLRQPIRLTDADASRSDLRSLTATVLAGFGYPVGPNDRLQALLVQALTEGQSNAYIDALLNTAAARGEFEPPVQLQMASGRLDTNTLLLALVRHTQG